MRPENHGAALEFELIVEEMADSRPFSGFYLTRTRTFFVNNWGHAYLLAAPGHRAMLQRIDALPDDAEPTRSITDRDLWMLARAAQVLGHGLGDAGALPIADFYAARGRLFHVRACRVFELRQHADGPRFVDVAALPRWRRALHRVRGRPAPAGGRDRGCPRPRAGRRVAIRGHVKPVP